MSRKRPYIKGDEKADIKNPESLTYFYMDTMMCNNFYQQN